MKQCFLLLTIFSLLVVSSANAQNTFPASGAAGIGTTTPNASSILEMQSTSKGLLIPRMTKAQRDAIVSPATGLQIYDLDSKLVEVYNGTSWESISASAFESVGEIITTPGNTWTKKADLAGPARTDAVGFSIGTKGYIGTGLSGGSKKDFWQFDPATNAWTQKADFGGTARLDAVGFAIGAKGYIGTGSDAGGKKKDFWEYNPATNTWLQKADFGGTARSFAVGFSIGTKGYMGTGEDGSFTKLKDFWEYDPATNLWTQKADLAGSARSQAVGFAIGNKGYVGTGLSDSGNKKDFWQYNPSTNTWLQRTDFGGTARTSATGFAINTKGYIGTGKDGSSKKDFWEYDSNTNTWTQKADFGGAARLSAVGFSIGTTGYIGTGLSTALEKDFWQYTSTIKQQVYEPVLPDGGISGLWSINATGINNVGAGNVGIGSSSPASSAKLDVSSTTQGFLVPRMSTAQRDAILSPAAGLQVYNLDNNLMEVYNGTTWGSAPAYVATGEVITTPGTNAWTQKADFGGGIRGLAVGFSIGNKGYAGTGLDANNNNKKDFWEYDPVSNAWTQKADFGGTARVAATGFSLNGKGYIGIGQDAPSHYLKDFWEYNPATNSWVQKADFGGTQRCGAVGFSIGNKGYLGTGYDGTDKKDFWEYNPATNAWVQKADFVTARGGAAGFSINNKGYIGTGNDGNMKNDFWEYDPATNQWVQKADFGGSGRFNAVGFSFGNKGYIGTGSDGSSKYSDFWEYDPAGNLWTKKADFDGVPRNEAIGFSIGNKGYIGTGNSLGAGNTKDFWEFTPTNYQSVYDPVLPGAGVTGLWTKNGDGIYNINSGNIGIGLNNPVNKLDVEGGVSIGSTYSGTNTAPTNGAIIEGKVGIGLNAPVNKLDVEGGIAIGSTYSGTNAAPANGAIIEGNVGIGIASPATSAKLDVNSTTQGFLPPRMTTEQRNSIAAPATGLHIYNLDNKLVEVYNGTGWGSSAPAYESTGEFISIPGSEAWTQKADFGGTARAGAVGFSIGTKGYIGTGTDGSNKKDFWMYDPATNVWTQKADFGGTARKNAVGFSINSKGYIGTGSDGSNKKDFWEYDPVSNAWTQKANFGGTSRNGAVGFAIGTKGYIGTGTDGSNKKDFWEYDPASNAWTQKTNFGGTARVAAVGFSVSGKGYIGTGFDGTGNKNDCWEYDPATNAWVQKTNFGGTPRANAVGFSIGTKGYIATGQDGSNKNDSWEYDPATNTWAQQASFSGTARNAAVGFSIGSKGYIGTGYDGTNKKDFLEYTPLAYQPLYESVLPGGGVVGLWTKNGEEIYNVNSGNIGIGLNAPVNKLDVEGGVSIGATYSGTNIAPVNGAIVEGDVGIGLNAPVNKLDVEGAVSIGTTYSGTSTAPANGAIIEGKVGIGVSTPVNKVDVEGGIAIGAAYSGTHAAPANGAIIEGNVGIGTADPDSSSMLDLTSTSKGFLPPRMSTEQRDNIANPATGLHIYNLDNNLVEVFNGTNWGSSAPAYAATGDSVIIPGTNAWTQKADFGGTPRKGAVSFSIGNKGYIGTGNDGAYKKDFWEYDPSTNSWTQKADYGDAEFQTPAREAAVGFAIGNKGYVGTGIGAIGRLQDFWEYDPSFNAWTRKENIDGGDRSHAVGFSIGDKGYIGTGIDLEGLTLNDFWEFDPATNAWTQKANFGGIPRGDAAGFSIGNKGYIGTGFNNLGGNLQDFWEYDPATNHWTQKTDFEGGVRLDAVGFSMGNKGYIGTGNSSGTLKKDFWEYDPATDDWIQKPDFSGTSRDQATGFSIGSKAYIGTGIDQANTSDFREFTLLDYQTVYEPVVPGGGLVGLWAPLGNNIYNINSGNVGIGLNNPVNKLDVKGGIAIGDAYAGTDTVPANGAIIEGKVGIGTTTPGGQFELSLDEGRKPSTSTWTITSDERLKRIDGDYSRGLQDILLLKPVRYHYMNFGKRTFDADILLKENVGFSAQAVQKVFPEAVSTDDDGYLSFNIHPILVAEVNAIRELNEKVEKIATPSYNDSLVNALKQLVEEQQTTIVQQQQFITDQQQINADLNTKLDAMLNQMNVFELSLSKCCTVLQEEGKATENPDQPKLEQNVPNPFLQTCYIRFYIPSTAKSATLMITDIKGSMIKQFTGLKAGYGTVNMDYSMLLSGTYQYTLFIDGKPFETKQMILQK